VHAPPNDDLASSMSLDILRPSTSPGLMSPKLSPDQNYYRHSTAMGAGTAYILTCELVFSGFFLYIITFSDALVSVLRILGLGCLIPPIALWATILVSFPMDFVASGKGMNWHLGVLQTVNVVFISGVSAGLIYLIILAQN
jgi:hypothetical protein